MANMKTACLWIQRLLPIISLLFLTACHESEVFEQMPDCEVTVNLFVETPKTRVGDPGNSSEETDVFWTSIDLFFVYDNGRVIQETLNETDFKEQSSGTFLFAVPEGSMSVYGVAYGKGQEPLKATTPEQVKALRTQDITTIADSKQKKEYLLSLFSGKTDPQTVSADNPVTFSMVLNRLIAKIDLQWDAQGAYANNKFTDVQMGDMSLTGLAQGYFFPEEMTADLETAALTPDLQTYKVADPISQRNGRTYFYAFSGVASRIAFDVTYTSAGADPETPDVETRSYEASFKQPLDKASWHKVNLNVVGTKTSTSGNVVSIPL